MARRVRVVCLAIAGTIWVVAPAAAQMLPWFNGFGLSAGGGAVRFAGRDDEDPVLLFARPDDWVGSAAFGAELRRGNRHWALLLPEFEYLPVLVDADSVTGTLTLGSRTITFEPESQSAYTLAVLAGAQVGLVPSGRVWVRGGIGVGWITSNVSAKDQNIAIDLSTDDRQGLALAAAAGVSLWTKQQADGASQSIDVEADYVTVRTSSLRISAPSARVGWRVMFPMPRQ